MRNELRYCVNFGIFSHMRPEMMPGRKPEGQVSLWIRRDKQVFGLPVPFTGKAVRVGEVGELTVKTGAGLVLDALLEHPDDTHCTPVRLQYEVTGDCSLAYRLERVNGLIDEPKTLNGAIQIENDQFAVRAGFWVKASGDIDL